LYRSAQYDLGDAALSDIIEADLLEQLMEEVELLQVWLLCYTAVRILLHCCYIVECMSLARHNE
jgi:hypothetical protein